jgi:hypothetical protein
LPTPTNFRMISAKLKPPHVPTDASGCCPFLSDVHVSFFRFRTCVPYCVPSVHCASAAVACCAPPEPAAGWRTPASARPVSLPSSADPSPAPECNYGSLPHASPALRLRCSMDKPDKGELPSSRRAQRAFKAIWKYANIRHVTMSVLGF